MRKTCICLAVVLVALQYLFVSGCGRQPGVGGPLPLNICRTSSFDVLDTDIEAIFAGAGVAAVNIVTSQAFATATINPNEFNVNNVSRAGLSVDEVGYGGYGNDNIIVDQDRIETFFEGETNRTRQKICALTIAHEIGHVFLGDFHQTGSTNNVMTNSISNVLEGLKVCTWPVFSTSQAEAIRRCLGN